jgi:GT2 family glycosyltransferase
LDLTIVIVNWNAGDMLRNCLASIRNAPKARKVEVIVIDNASADGSREMASREFPEFQVINSGANLGFGKANNLARPHVRTPLVLFLNPDTVVLGNALDQMAAFLESHPETGALSCQMKYQDGSVQGLGIQWFPTPITEFFQLALLSAGSRKFLGRILPTWNPEQSGYVKKLYGGCLMARKELLDEVGWFDERYFMYAEDVDLCRQITNRGRKLYYLSSAAIVHLVGGTTSNTNPGFHTLMMCESIAKLMAKYYGRLGRCLYVLAMLAGSHARLLFVGASRLLSWLTPFGRHTDYRSAWEKCSLTILWCLGIRKPILKG